MYSKLYRKLAMHILQEKYPFLKVQKRGTMMQLTLQNFENNLQQLHECMNEIATMLKDERVILDIIAYHIDYLPNIEVLGAFTEELGIQAPIVALPEYIQQWQQCKKIAIWSSSIYPFDYATLPPVELIELRVREFDCVKMHREHGKIVVMAEQVNNRELCSNNIQLL